MDLKRLADEAMARLHALTPEQQAAHWKAQRESWVRAFTTPCEHGELDFEQCAQCHTPTESERHKGDE